MVLDREITVAITRENESYKQLKIVGRASGSPTAFHDSLYTVRPPFCIVNGTFYDNPVGFLTWNSAVPLAEGDTIISEVPAYILGTRQDKSTNLITNYGIPLLPLTPLVLEEGYNYSVTIFFSNLIGVNEMAGTLGKFNYVDDKGTTFVMRMDASNAAAVGNTAAAADAVVNLPGRLRVRYLLAEQTDNAKVKRRIPVGAGNNTNYINGGTITLETVTGNKSFRITGRVGEKFSF